MTFEKRITRSPIAFDPERGKEARATTALKTGALGDLIEGAAGSSPYLYDLIESEADWLGDAFANPEAAFDALLKPFDDTADKVLRARKRKAAVLTALADLGGVWSLEEVTGALTRFADFAVDTALKQAIAREISRKKLPGQKKKDIKTAGGLSVIAMGKMGAHELNYSSDIDLICLFDETRFDPDDYADARASFIRAVRAMHKTLNDRTEEGYVFRTDLRLRPDASVTPVALSMEAAERYYESFGRTWERAAYIKARACAGDIKAGAAFLQTLRPFVWRRHLDYAAIQDAQDMRLRIRDHKGLTAPISHLGHDLKLGEGGIREIEFFTQTRQIIAGGRDPELRSPRTVEGLAALAEKDWIDADTAAQLTEDYRAHREAEHRVQMIADQQTHDLPDTEEGFARFAALSGEDPKTLAKTIGTRLKRVSKTTEALFLPTPEPQANQADAPETVERWSGYAALRSPRAEAIFRRVWPQLEARLNAASHPDEAHSNFERFLSGLPAGVQLFSLFESNPQLLDLVVDIVGTAPHLGEYLAENSSVFDAVLGGQFFSDWPGVDDLADSLAKALEDHDDYETKLDRARVWAREWRFRVGVHLLRGLVDAETSGAQFADVAEASVRGLFPVVLDDFARKYGKPPGRGAAVLAMGSLGAGRLHAASDLDLIVIFDAKGAEASKGKKSLPTRTYFSRATQALVTALSAPTAEGRLYEVDMRLRPSGNSGPVATSLQAFQDYQKSDAWTWEHLALARARPVAGDASLQKDIAKFRATLLKQERDRDAVLKDVRDMRQRLREAKPSKGGLDMRAGPGRLQDVELFAQTGALLTGAASPKLADQLGAALKDAKVKKAKSVTDAAALLWRVQSRARLIFGNDVLPGDAIGNAASEFLCKPVGAKSITALEALLEKQAKTISEVIDRYISNG